MDLSLYHAEIAAVESRAGRDHTAPRLLISLWLYAYGRGISSARELSRQCEFEPGSMWLCGCQPISYRTLSGFRSDYQVALDDLFVQVLGMLSAEYICPRDAGQTKLPHVIKTPAGDSGDRSFGGYFVCLASPV
jgi:transposase